MKKFTIEISHASPGQLTTIAAELKIMSNGWAKHGPQIVINKQQNKFTIEVSHASPGQLTTIGLELKIMSCLLYTSPSPRDRQKSRMPSSA